jgi:hypothetical protein
MLTSPPSKSMTLAPLSERNGDTESMLSSRLDDDDDLINYKFKSYIIFLYKAKNEIKF